VKFLSRLLTALNLLPSMATLAFVRKAYLSANGDELCAYLAYRRPIILAEIGNRLVIRNQPTGEPHHLNIAPALALKPAARLNPIEITIDVELEHHRRMVRRPADGLGINPAKPKPGQIEPPDKDINHANRIILANLIFQAFRKKGALPAIHPLNKALHPIPPQIAQESYRENHIDPRVLTHGVIGAAAFRPSCMPARWRCGLFPGERSWINTLHWTSRSRRPLFVFSLFRAAF
jgi:hypothetical protein